MTVATKNQHKPNKIHQQQTYKIFTNKISLNNKAL